jgi:sulfate transport system ATP-binding protein
MDRGRIEQTGAPQEVYDHPATPFVYEFLGHVNRFDCFLRGGGVDVCGTRFEVSGAESVLDGPSIAYVRPHDLELSTFGGAGVPAIVRYVTAAGPVAHVELSLDGRAGVIEAELARSRLQELAFKVGDSVQVSARAARIFPAPSTAGQVSAMPTERAPIPRALAS